MLFPFMKTWCVTSADSVCYTEKLRGSKCALTQSAGGSRVQTFYWLIPNIRQCRHKHVDIRLKHLPHHSETWSWHPASKRHSLNRKDVEKVKIIWKNSNNTKGTWENLWRYQSLCWRCLWQICPNLKMQEGRPLYLFTEFRVHSTWNEFMTT